MSNTVIKIEELSKRYRLGLVGSGTLKDDLKGCWYRMRGKEDLTLSIGEENRIDSQSGKYVWALKDINLEVKQGEVLGIIGKNGAGKSTLLKILSRVTGPTKGQIKTVGRIASLLEVGTGMHPELTGRENVYLNGAILGMKKHEIRSKFDEIVEFAGVSKYIETPVKRYSSGMHVRLGFAVAAFLEPEILIVDEVLAVGDAEFQRKAIGKMQDVSKGEGRTVLFVSHNMVSVQKLCTSCLLLKRGSIHDLGRTSSIIEQYIANKEIIASYSMEKDRIQNEYGVYFSSIELKDAENNSVKGSFFSKEDVLIDIHVISEIDIKNIVITIGLNDKYNNRVATWRSSSNDEVIDLSDEKHIKVRIDGLNIVDGIYSFSFGIVKGGKSLEYLDNVINIKILRNDLLRTLKDGISDIGYLVTNANWEI